MKVKNRVYGGKCGELLATYNRESSFWRTLQISFNWADVMSLDRLPRSGMMRSGRLYPLVSEDRVTYENAGFVLPTPTARAHASEIHHPSAWGRNASLSVEVCKTMKVTKEQAIGSGMRLHPQFVEWMMGFPIGWTDIEP